MKLQRATVIETTDERWVEMLYAERPEPEEHEAQIRFVVLVSAEGYPPIAKLQLDALHDVQAVLDGEIRRLQAVRGPSS